jgi:tRNA1Val (adenine37-N6)-methyltransferase
MSIFQFKQFSVKQVDSAMKIGTDSVLLGCFCQAGNAHQILDIGTGTGLLALMLAQKCDAKIDAVELDNAAAREAEYNFNQSPWGDRIRLFRDNILAFNPGCMYDLIISNPPYYRHKSSMSIADEQRSKARHDKDLPFASLVETVKRLMNDGGKFWLILPNAEAKIFSELAVKSGLYLQLKILVHSKAGKPHNREIICYGKQITNQITTHFTVYDEQGLPTAEYKALTAEYYLWKENATDNRLKW